MPYFFSERIIEEGVYICKNSATVRQTAQHFGLSKSCIHKDVSEKLKVIHPELYAKVKEILKTNFSQKHLRGGLATQKKYFNQKSR